MATSSVSSTCSRPVINFKYAERWGSETRSNSRVTSGEITARYSESSCSHQRMVRSRRNGSPLSRYAPMTEVSRYVLGFMILLTRPDLGHWYRLGNRIGVE